MGRIGNIINRKGKQDAKRAKIFTKHARAIAVAAKEGGPDPEYNAALKTAIEKAKALLTDDPYDIDIKPDNETDNINARIMHVYLKASGLRMIFEKQLIQKIIPAMIVPAINTRHKVNNMNGTINPATIMLEQEKLLYGNCIKPAMIVPNNIPAHFVPAYIHERYNFDERRD